MLTFAVSGEMALKGADRGASGESAMRLSAKGAAQYLSRGRFQDELN